MLKFACCLLALHLPLTHPASRAQIPDFVAFASKDRVRPLMNASTARVPVDLPNSIVPEFQLRLGQASLLITLSALKL